MFTFRLNGEPVQVDDPAPGTTLLEFLRARGLTGSKEGCAEGECGACAVAMVVPRGDQSQYRVINSCLMLAPMAADREVYTIEALARDGVLLDVQHAMAEAGGSQCGYCTPGFVMSLFAEQHRADRHGPCDPRALAGNLCRCTGYRPIRDAVRSVGDPPDGPWLDRLTRSAPTISPVASARFSRPGSLTDCIDVLSRMPGSKLVAGATDLGVESNLHHRRWPHLVSLEGVEELRVFSDSPTEVRIGACLTLTEIGERWRDAPRAFHTWLELFASPLIRNRATLGGNLATGSPIGDAAPLLLAMNASVELASTTGRRVVTLDTFFTGYRTTALRPAEVMTAVVVPKPFSAALSFSQSRKATHG